MSEFNKSYRIRTEVGKDKQVVVKLDQKYDTLEIMSLKINQKNAYRLHTSNYGVIAGRVLANDSFGIPNAKVSVFINIDDNDVNDTVKRALYPYNTTNSKDKNGVKYNLLPDEQLTDCHTIIGTFPEKQYALDNDSVLEVFEKYYKYTTKTNSAGDYMIFGVPVGSQTIHVDIDLSDIGILSQKPRDMVYKGYNINQFENPNKFKYDTNLNSLTQFISQDNVTEVISFWGDKNEGTIGITRCDINIQYKFEPTCVFMGSVVSDTASHGISKKCIPSPGMGAMDELTTGSGTIEMIRKKPDGGVEEFQIQGTQLINGDGVWCYQIPMNLDYMMTDEFGNMVPTNDPKKGLPTRTKVRFRISMQDFETDNSNIFRGKMLVPHNPDSEDNFDYQFGTNTRDESYRDLFWNGVYSVKSYIPRLQKGTNWRTEKFTGFKRVNYYGDKNPIPYNNIRIRIPFMFTLVCAIFKCIVAFMKFYNALIYSLFGIISLKKANASFSSMDGSLCSEDMENVCFIPGVNVITIRDRGDRDQKGLFARTMQIFGANAGASNTDADEYYTPDKQSIDSSNEVNTLKSDAIRFQWNAEKTRVDIYNLRVTTDLDYFVQCIEMNLAQEYKVMQFDFYNDWINGLLYIPRWMRTVTKKHTFFWGKLSFGGKVKACMQDTNFSRKRNIVQQCGLDYNITSDNHKITTSNGCVSGKNKLICHKSPNVRKSVQVFHNRGGIVKSIETLKKQFVYYFKPGETSDGGKFIKMFATDIILLGTMNDCDKWGIPNNLSELLSSTFQMPPNIALTDSDIDGDLYDNGGTHMAFQYVKEQDGKNGANLKVSHFEVSPKALMLLDEDGNYTEVSGIEWGYNGPLQMTSVSTDSPLYRPGGHFLGLSCRNSETTIKSCVNLSRICEYGVWMSQRQELTIPNTNKNTYKSIATVPTGIIAKDEISDTIYRSLFATMNLNNLKTVINTKTGYPIYDFIHVNPTNFGGELNTVMSISDFNEKVVDSVKEKYYNYDLANDIDGSNYTKRDSSVETITVEEKQIRRVGEWMDNEYWRFRFGIKETDKNTIRSKKIRKYLVPIATNTYSFPVFENSFYFYFGLRDGATALDEFKKQYYSVCQKSKSLVQTDNSINLNKLNVIYDGMCSNNGTGEISFTVKASSNVFGESGVTVINKNTNKTTTIKDGNTVVKYTGLKAGTYSIYIENETGEYNAEFNIDVKSISISANLSATNFKQNVNGFKPSALMGQDKKVYGGYISFRNNTFSYNKGQDTSENTNKSEETVDTSIIEGDIFTSPYIKKIRITDSKNRSYTSGIGDSKTRFTVSGASYTITTNDKGEYMIPVPYADETYKVELETASVNCKPSDTSTVGSIWWNIGSIEVNNAVPLNFTFGNLSYMHHLKGALTEGGGENDYIGWWGGRTNATLDSLGNANSWYMKELLYMYDISTEATHTIKITPDGGAVPYTETLEGANNAAVKPSTGLTMSDLDKIQCPTINYRTTDDRRRVNFSYQVKDNNGQTCPDTGKFVFPVIYKPFFMEMGVWYLDENDKYYLAGNVYNGKTWDYANEGFNNCKLNNLLITNFATITKNDATMELDEPSRGYTEGGYGYYGKYNSETCKNTYKYNGRKVVVTREVEPISYGLHSDGTLTSLNLSVGCSHTQSGVVYEESISAEQNGLRFYKYITSIDNSDGGYRISMKPDFSGSETKPTTFIINTDDYDYPYTTSGKFELSDRLHCAIMDGTLKSSKLGLYYDGSKNSIDVNKLNGAIDKIYYLTIPSKDSGKIENSLNILQTVSLSSLIRLDNLAKFFPFNISATGKDILKEDGKYQTEITIKADTGSENNFKNKKIVLTFYPGPGKTSIPLHTTTVMTGAETSATTDLTVYRSILGLNNSSKTIYFYFDVYDGADKSPTSYIYKTKDTLYSVNFQYIDNTPAETTS